MLLFLSDPFLVRKQYSDVDLDLEMEFCVLFIGKMQKIDLITAKPHGMPSSLIGFEFFFYYYINCQSSYLNYGTVSWCHNLIGFDFFFFLIIGNLLG